MFHLTIPIDIPLDALNEKYLPFVCWDQISHQEIRTLSTHKLKYLKTSQLIVYFGNQQTSGMSDEDVMSVIVRDIEQLSNDYDYYKESNLINFMNSFVNFELLKNNYRQILAIKDLNESDKIHHIERIIPAFVMRNFLSTDELIGYGIHLVDWVELQHPNVSLERRFEMLKSGSITAYNINYNYDVYDMPVILKRAQLLELPGMVVPDVFNKSEFYQPPPAFVFRNDELHWDDLVDLYYAGSISYSDMQSVWKKFITSHELGVHVIEHRLENRFVSQSAFSKEDFKCS